VFAVSVERAFPASADASVQAEELFLFLILFHGFWILFAGVYTRSKDFAKQD
jgi:hypothetical protein